MTMSMFLHLYRAPVWRCILATLVAVPFSYFGVLFAMTPGQGVANPAAAAAYFFICIVLALPLALVNAFAIAPCVVKTVHGRFSAVGSHLILAAAWAGLVFVGYFAVPRLPAALDWVMLFWYLASFLGPAVIAGSFVYSLKYDSTGSRRINMRSATRRCGYFGAVGPPNSLAIAWGRCPQTPEIYRFGPGAWFRRRITVVSRTSICCAYHVNSPHTWE